MARIVPFVAAPPSRASSAAFAAVLLGDRLDDEGGVAQGVEVVGYGHVARAHAAAPLDQPLHLRGGGVRAARPQDDLAVLGRHAREPGGDGAASGDPDPF